MYIMIYLLHDNTLPWSNFAQVFKDKNYEFKDYLRERIDIKYTREVIDMCPKSMTFMLKKILTMKFEEVPPYDDLI